MHHADEHRDEPLIDLGAITEETKGLGGSGSDAIAQRSSPGLTDE